MDHIKVADAAKVLGLTDSATDETTARAILRYFGVETVDGPVATVNGRPFGKPAKLYNAAQVERLAHYRKRFHEGGV